MTRIEEFSEHMVRIVISEAVQIISYGKKKTLLDVKDEKPLEQFAVPIIIVSNCDEDCLGSELEEPEIQIQWECQDSRDDQYDTFELNVDCSEENSTPTTLCSKIDEDRYSFEEIDLRANDGHYVQYEYVDDVICVNSNGPLNFNTTNFQENHEEVIFEKNWLELEAGSELRRRDLKSADECFKRGQVRSIVAQFEGSKNAEKNVENAEASLHPVESYSGQPVEVLESLREQIEKMLERPGKEDASVQTADSAAEGISKFYIGDNSDSDAGEGVINVAYEASGGESRQRSASSSRVLSLTSHRQKTWRCSWPEYVSTLFSILSLAGSLGNILRLPRMVYFHGGGIFLLVYILVTIIFGLPLTFLEIGLGQFCQHGAVKMWRAVNILRGVGYAKVFLSLVGAIYYSVQVSTSLSFLTWTLKGPLPFSECNFVNENGTSSQIATGERCLKATFLSPVFDDALGFGIILIFLLLIWAIVLLWSNSHRTEEIESVAKELEKNGPENNGVMKRSATYRRAMYFLFPGCTALLVALLVEATSRSTAGITTLFTFHWAGLADVQVWYFAIVQMFFSLHIGFGNINTCAGRIYPKSNAFWTAITLVVSNVLMGVAVVILVYLWIDQIKETGLQLPSVSEVPELFLVTVIYNIGVSGMSKLPMLWTSLAYVLIFIAGLSSLIVFIYTILVAAAIETKRKWHWWHINVLVCFTACILAICATIPSFQVIPHILDHYVISRGVVFLTILELIGFGMIYGCSNLYNDLEFVIGTKLSSVWRSLWIVTPFVLFIIEVCSANLLPLDGEKGMKADDLWEFSLGWALYFFCWLIVLTFAIYQVCVQVDYNLPQKFMSAVKPSRNWGPVDPIYRHCWVQWRNRYNLTGTRDFTLKRRGTRDYTHHARTAPPDSVSNSFDMGGINPGGDWGYKRASSTPVKLDYGPDNILWKKGDSPPTRH